MDTMWQALSEEILSGVKEWRLARPKATFREIEQVAHERVSLLEARLVQDVALASAAKEWKRRLPRSVWSAQSVEQRWSHGGSTHGACKE